MFRTRYAKFAAQQAGPDTAWFRHHEYDPPFLLALDEKDDETLVAWQEQTIAQWPNAGASGPEMMTMLAGLIMSSGITRVVQCGHYVGFSTLILGFICRSMGSKRFLYTVDIDRPSSDYTQQWLERTGLADDVKLVVRDSSDPVNVVEAASFLGGAPQLVYIDSSHQYAHTLAELRLWWDALPPGGMIVMHDISQFAAEFDRTKLGGSHRAALEFCQTTAANSILLNGNFSGGTTSSMPYSDVCGLGLLQKPF